MRPSCKPDSSEITLGLLFMPAYYERSIYCSAEWYLQHVQHSRACERYQTKLTRKQKQLEGSPQAGGSGTPAARAGVVLPNYPPNPRLSLRPIHRELVIRDTNIAPTIEPRGKRFSFDGPEPVSKTKLLKQRPRFFAHRTKR